MLSLLFELIAGLFGSVGYSDALNTKKIDQNIERLNQYDWVKKIYDKWRKNAPYFNEG